MSSPDRPTSPVARTSALSAEQRAALIAQLSERLAAVPSDPTSAPPERPARPPGSSERSGSSGGGSRWSAPSRSAGPTAVGGSGTQGSTARRRPEGGHPEDAPGDPATLARQICLKQLTAAAKPRAALADVLRRRGIPDDVADSVLDRFTEVGLIDDEAYAAAFVSTKQRDRSLGARALRMELRRKGVDDHVVSGAVADIDESDERDRASALVARRIDAALAAGPVAARRRLVGLLARRGYPSGLAHAVVSEALDRHPGAEADDPDGVGIADGPDLQDPPVDDSPVHDSPLDDSPLDDPALDHEDADRPRPGDGRSRWPRRSLRFR